MPLKLCLALPIFFLGLFPLVSAQSVEFAKEYHQHGLDERAKDILITTIYGGAIPSEKAKALYLLGQISFDEGHMKVALADWQRLVKEYPQTPEAKEISGRLAQLNEIVTTASDANVSPVIARSYLSNGDFWSKKENAFRIDSSGLPKWELALRWYDKVILEFPGTDAAELAYEKKIFTLLDSKTAVGLKVGFKKYMQLLLDFFASLQHEFPNNSSLQAFRYQISQAYWEEGDWPNARTWLRKVVDSGNGEETFWTETAKARITLLDLSHPPEKERLPPSLLK